MAFTASAQYPDVLYLETCQSSSSNPFSTADPLTGTQLPGDGNGVYSGTVTVYPYGFGCFNFYAETESAGKYTFYGPSGFGMSIPVAISKSNPTFEATFGESVGTNTIDAGIGVWNSDSSTGQVIGSSYDELTMDVVINIVNRTATFTWKELGDDDGDDDDDTLPTEVYVCVGTGGANFTPVANPSTDTKLTSSNGVFTGSVVGTGGYSGTPQTSFCFYSLKSDGTTQWYYPEGDKFLGYVPNTANVVTTALAVNPRYSYAWIIYSSTNGGGSYFTSAEVTFTLDLNDSECTTVLTKLPDPVTITFTGDWNAANAAIYNEELDEVEGTWTGSSFKMNAPTSNTQIFILFDQDYDIAITGSPASNANTWTWSGPDNNPDVTEQQIVTLTLNPAVGNNPTTITVNITETDYNTYFTIEGDTDGLEAALNESLQPYTIENNKFSVLVPPGTENTGATQVLLVYNADYELAITSDGLAESSTTYEVYPPEDVSSLYPGCNYVQVNLMDGARQHSFVVTLTAPNTPIDFNDFKASPEELETGAIINELWGFTFTWNYPVQILDESKIYVQIPGGGELTGGNGLNCTTDGNSLIVDIVNSPLINTSGWEAWNYVGVRDGGISVNGQVLDTSTSDEDGEYEGMGVMRMYDMLSSGVAIDPDEILSVPPKGSNPSVQTIDAITLSMNDYYIGYGDGYSWNEVQNNTKIYECANGEWNFFNGTPIDVTFEFGAPNDPIYGGRWYESLTVKPAQTLDNPKAWYILVIPGYNIGWKSYDGDTTVDNYTEQIENIYTVSGAGAMTIKPGKYQNVQASDFKGLVLGSAISNGVSVVDASKVKLYLSPIYISNQTTLDESTLLASGSYTADGSDDITITFPGAELTNGPMTILVETGALQGISYNGDIWTSVNGVGQALWFTMQGLDFDINKVTVNTDPEDGATVDSCETVQVWWGTGYKLVSATMSHVDPTDPESPLVPDPIKATMDYNGSLKQVEFACVVEEQQEDERDPDEDDGEGGEVGGISGGYIYKLAYTPDAPLANGTYKFTLPAGVVTVEQNQFNSALNNAVEFSFTVGEPEYTYVLSGPIFVDETNAKEMTLGEDGVYTITANVWPQSFNIKKMNGEELVATIGAETNANAANELTHYGVFQGAVDSGIDWVLTGVTATPITGKLTTFEFNPETLVLNVPEPAAVEYIDVAPVTEPADGAVVPSVGDVVVQWPGVEFKNLVGVA
ncbi:MAG: hypothetical protein J1F07_04345, partial [Muribaculaceae bacterium]|nr:hypothetical protein [Muribaculaceae bacterium]